MTRIFRISLSDYDWFWSYNLTFEKGTLQFAAEESAISISGIRVLIKGLSKVFSCILKDFPYKLRTFPKVQKQTYFYICCF